jgi:hypothetical protein
MKILVQNCLNHLYLKTPSEWTADPEDARNFSTSEKALGYCAEHRIPAVQIVLKFNADRYDIQMPITPECEESRPPQRALLS